MTKIMFRLGIMFWNALVRRMHISSTGKITDFTLVKDYPQDPRNGYYMLIGMLGKHQSDDIKDFNRIDISRHLSSHPK